MHSRPSVSATRPKSRCTCWWREPSAVGFATLTHRLRWLMGTTFSHYAMRAPARRATPAHQHAIPMHATASGSWGSPVVSPTVCSHALVVRAAVSCNSWRLCCSSSCRRRQRQAALASARAAQGRCRCSSSSRSRVSCARCALGSSVCVQKWGVHLRARARARLL